MHLNGKTKQLESYSKCQDLGDGIFFDADR